jgi:hypothetical protein
MLIEIMYYLNRNNLLIIILILLQKKHGIMNDNDVEGYIIDEVVIYDSEDELDSINCNTCWKCMACAFKIIT